MADLDDFFAKKDKKKTKTKKFTTSEEVVKNLEDTSKRNPDQKKLKDRPPSTIDEESANVKEAHDDDWKVFEEEERKDYSGLKIVQLTLYDELSSSSSHLDGDNTFDSQNDGENYFSNTDEKNSGAWKKKSVQAGETPITIGTEKRNISLNKGYICPALRSQPLKLKNRTAPDITNQEYFPTLGAARPEEQKKKKPEPVFEEVRHGGRISKLQSEVPTTYDTVGNRFKSLEDDDSSNHS